MDFELSGLALWIFMAIAVALLPFQLMCFHVGWLSLAGVVLLFTDGWLCAQIAKRVMRLHGSVSASEGGLAFVALGACFTVCISLHGAVFFGLKRYGWSF